MRPKKVNLGPIRNRWNPIVLLLILWGGILVAQYFFMDRGTTTLTYSEFLEKIDHGKIDVVTLSKSDIRGKLKEGPTFHSVPLEDPTLVPKLREKGVKFEGTIESSFWGNLLAWMVPIFLFYVIWRLNFGGMGRGGQGGLLTLGKSRAKIFVEKDTKTRFTDVAGVDEAKEELKEIVDFLKEPARYSKLGGRSPKGVLLVGPPGTGKTLLARAVAGEASVPFFSINGSEFVEMFVGLGAARVRDLFEQARKSAPCILFVDELDALGKSRALGYLGSGANDEKEQTLNQLLAELDGFDTRMGIVILAATNRPEILDPALLRAGRFDRQILVDNPDQQGREQILQIHAKKIKVDPSAELKKIASLTPGFSGADLANLVNEAAWVATRRKAQAVEEQDFTQAIERIVAGLERKKRIMNPDEKRRVAFHEMGHATVGLSLSTTERVHKVSIIPRGIGALGYTLQRPTEDRYLMTRKELTNRIAVLLGGRVSEMKFLGDLSTGAADDLSKATHIARAMVTQYAMSEQVGLLSLEQPESPFLHGQINPLMSHEKHSQKTMELVDRETNSILEQTQLTTRSIIDANATFINEAVKLLLEKETLDEADLKALWEKTWLA